MAGRSRGDDVIYHEVVGPIILPVTPVVQFSISKKYQPDHRNHEMFGKYAHFARSLILV
jgi:hypothetical protein